MKEENNEHELEPIFSEKELEEDLSEEQLEEKGFKISESWLFKFFLNSANRLLHRPITIFQILKSGVERFQQYDSIQEFADDAKERFMLIIRLLQAYLKGEYTEISKTNIVLSLAVILYFISPIDLIPDFLVAGFIDDLAILSWAYHNFHQEIEAFLLWEEENKMIRIDLKGIDDDESI